MNVAVYANLSTLSLEADLDGGEFSAPVIPAYQDIFLDFRPSKEIEGTNVADRRAIRATSARIGWPGRAPEQGEYELEITLGADSATASGLTSSETAATLETKLNAVLNGNIATLHPCTVTDYQGGLRIKFANNAAEPVITCTDNALWPMSFVEVDRLVFDEGFVFILDVVQAPVAEISGAETFVPSPPVITERQPGFTLDGSSRNAIQKLFIPAAFSNASYVLKRNGTRSVPLPSPTPINDISSALEPLKDEGGIWAVSPAPGGVYIEFRGEMAGEPQDLIEVEVFESPQAYHRVRLATRTPGVRTLLRGANDSGEIEVPLNLRFEVEDEVSPGVWQEKVFSLPIKFTRPVSDDDRNVGPELRYNQPLSQGDYLKHSTDSLVIGSRGMEFPIGDGAATEFTLNHNLVENPQTFTADAGTDTFTAVNHNYQDLDPLTLSKDGGDLPTGLDETMTYFVLNATADTFQLSLQPNGAAEAISDAGTGTHTARLKDGTVTGVMVEVWRTTGSEDRLAQSTYTCERLSLDAVRLSGFPTVLGNGECVAYVQTIGRPATYQRHHHEIDETPEAKQRIEALEAAVAALKATFPSERVRTDSGEPTYFRRREIPTFGSIYPVLGRGEVSFTPGARVSDFDLTSLADIFPSPLYGALHNASAAAALPTSGSAGNLSVTSPTEANRGVLYENTTESTLLLPVGRGWELPPGGYAASDGRTWYEVGQYGSAASTSYYPAHQVVTLWEETIEEEELLAGRQYEARFATGLALLRGNAPVYTHFVIEIANLSEDESPGATGPNLKDDDWDPDPVLDQRLTLTATPMEPVFGYRVTRAADGGLAADQYRYGKWSTTTAPDSARFAIRARLVRWDTPATPEEVSGFIAYSGPRFDAGPTTELGEDVGYSIVR